MGATEDALRQIEQSIIASPRGGVKTAMRLTLADILSPDELETLVNSVPRDVIESLGWGEVPSRAQLYPESIFATHENSVKDREVDSGASLGRRICQEDSESCEDCVAAASTYFDLIENIPEIGSLQCVSNCRCYFEYAEPGGSVV